jgi:hypothetical protein
MLYIQIASLVVGLIVACLQCGKEAAPVVRTFVELRQHGAAPQYSLYRGYDSDYQYWSDSTGTYWCRMNHQGVIEYSRNPNIPSQPVPPNIQICNVPNRIR